MITIKRLRTLIDLSLEEPVRVIQDMAGEWYSPYYSLFYYLSASLGGLAVELGTEKGRGLGSLAAGNENTRVIGIDHTRRPELSDVLDMFLNIRYIEADSLPVPEGVPSGITILHVDTEHSHAQAQAEFNGYKHLLAKGAVVCFDDLHAQEDSVLKYFQSLPYPKIKDDRLHPTCGYGVVIYE